MNNILIVEDDKTIRVLLAELLSNEGYFTAMASNGEEALEYLRRYSDKVKLVLLDLMMPVKDGYQLSREMQSDPSLSKIPIIIMSAAEQLTLAEQKIPARASIPKPIDVEMLIRSVSEILAD